MKTSILAAALFAASSFSSAASAQSPECLFRCIQTICNVFYEIGSPNWQICVNEVCERNCGYPYAAPPKNLLSPAGLQTASATHCAGSTAAVTELTVGEARAGKAPEILQVAQVEPVRVLAEMR